MIMLNKNDWTAVFHVCSIPFSVDDLMGFFHEKDFAEIKPTIPLVENPEFKFLVE